MEAKEMDRLLKNVAVEKPKAADMKVFRELLQRDSQAWKMIGDLSEQTREHILRSMQNDVLVETTKHSLRDLKEQFGYAIAPTLEQLLIENILNCWLQYHMTEYRYTSTLAGSMTLAQGGYWEKRLTAAQRRYLRAIETLAKVRRMKLPVVQVNIGEKQVNVVG